jgi:hypothetical protein
MNVASLFEQGLSEHVTTGSRSDVATTGESLGCGARNERDKRACSLYLWLLGPTAGEAATRCPCKA